MMRLSRTGVVIASVSDAIQESSGALRLPDRHVASLLAMTIPSERILVKRDSIATEVIGDSEEQSVGDVMAQETISIGGLVLRFLQTKEGTGGSLDAFEMTVQPNARMPIAHYHDSWDETIVGLMGVSTWRVDGQDIALEPGQSIFIRRGIVHAFRNDSEGAASCLCILTPGVLGPGYFREVAALVAGGAPDPAKMKEIMLRYGLHPAPQ